MSIYDPACLHAKIYYSMTFNPSLASSKNAFNIREAQQGIASMENQYQASILGNSNQEQDEIRMAMTQMRALLGEMRVRAQELIQDQLENKKANKGLSELAKA